MSENINNVVLEEEESSFDFKQLWILLRLNWYWIIISMVVCFLAAYVYLWFTPTTVTVSNKMRIIDNKNQSSAASARNAVLNSLPMGLGSSFGGSFGIEAEKEILKSKTLIRDVVCELGLYTEYRMGSWGRKKLIYKTQPIIVSLDPAHLKWMDEELVTKYHQIDLTIDKTSDGYKVETTLFLGKEETELPSKIYKSIPASLDTEYGTLTITENSLLTPKERELYKGNYSVDVTIVPPMSCAKKLSSQLNLEPPTKKVVNMLNISFSDESNMRGIDFVNSLVDQYNKRANDDKNEEVARNEEFVNNRMAKLDKEMGSSDAAWENTKKDFHITSPEVDAQEVMKSKSAYENQLVAIGTELQLHDYLSDYVNDPANLFEIIPSAAIPSGVSAGSESGAKISSVGASGTASLMAQHNGLIYQRRDLLKSVSEMSPQIQRLDETIRELHPVIQTALKRDRQQILMRQSTLQREYGKYMGRVGTAPQMERVLTEIGRERNIKQSVYLLMLQKREEAALDLAKSTRKGELIDETMVSGPRKPNRKMILLVSLFLGALLPMGILCLLQMHKNKIDTQLELEAATRFPVLSEVPLQDNGDAIRNLRTNLLLNLKENQKVILIASNADGDGKSFIAQHLTDSLNAIGKKTLYINADLRNANSKSSIFNFQLSKAHPSDVLASAEFASQLAEAKSTNDFVILDSPAMNQHADAYQLATFADTTLFVVKSGVTEKSVIEALSRDAKLPNIMLALNAIDTTTKKYKLNKKN